MRLALQSSFRLAASGDVVRRALMYAVVVGAILIAINHGDLDNTRLLKMVVTVFVFYAVSTLSSVQALRRRGDSAE